MGIGWSPPMNSNHVSYQQIKTRSDFHQIANLSTDYLALNWARPPFDDLEARQAFALAIDRDTLNALAIDSTIPTYHIAPQGESGYDDNLTNIDGRTGTAADKADAVMARQLTTDYARRKCGGNIAKCPIVTYNLSDASPANDDIARALLEMWRTAMPGYPINAVYADVLFPPIYYAQITEVGWPADCPDPQDRLSLVYLPGSPWNLTHVFDSKANDLMNKADVEQNQSLRFQEYNQAEQLLVNEVAEVVIGQQASVWLFDGNKIAGYRLNTSGYTTLPDWQNKIYVRR